MKGGGGEVKENEDFKKNASGAQSRVATLIQSFQKCIKLKRRKKTTKK